MQTVLVYKFPNLTTQDIQAMLGLSELKQTRVYQEALQEGEAVIVVRLLTRRLGNLGRITSPNPAVRIRLT